VDYPELPVRKPVVVKGGNPAKDNQGVVLKDELIQIRTKVAASQPGSPYVPADNAALEWINRQLANDVSTQSRSGAAARSGRAVLVKRRTPWELYPFRPPVIARCRRRCDPALSRPLARERT
jgi:hypothetical protein